MQIGEFKHSEIVGSCWDYFANWCLCRELAKIFQVRLTCSLDIEAVKMPKWFKQFSAYESRILICFGHHHGQISNSF